MKGVGDGGWTKKKKNGSFFEVKIRKRARGLIGGWVGYLKLKGTRGLSFSWKKRVKISKYIHFDGLKPLYSPNIYIYILPDGVFHENAYNQNYLSIF